VKAALGLLLCGVVAAVTACGAGHQPAAAFTACSPGSGPGVTAAAAGSARHLARSLATRRAGPACAARPGATVRYRLVNFYSLVTNPGSRHGFTEFATDTRDFSVLPSSAARATIVSATPARFSSPASRARWVAAGRPVRPGTFTAGQVIALPAGSFSFLPQRSLPYRQAATLPASAAAVAALAGGGPGSQAGPREPATVVLRQLGYLLAIAPLTPAARSAAWRAVAGLPGLRSCGTAADLAGRNGTGLCTANGGHVTELIVGAAGSVLAVTDRLTAPDSSYPTVPPGTVVQSATFIAGSQPR
jgi:hypothetical protein